MEKISRASFITKNFNPSVKILGGSKAQWAQMNEMEETYNGCLSKQYRCLISGSSSTGKSTLIQKLMINDNKLYPHDYDNIIYCHGVQTKALKSLQRYFGKVLQLFDHIPGNLVELCGRKEHNLLVLDDLDEAAFSNSDVASCFTKWSHHYNFNIILSTQNIFTHGSSRLTLLRNATHLILFPNYLDNTVPRLIAQKVLPGKTGVFLEIYQRAINNPYGYLAIFGTGPKILQFRTNISCPVQKIFVLGEASD